MLQDNRATTFGGAIHLYTFGVTDIQRTYFRNNHATYGGAIGVAGGGSSPLNFQMTCTRLETNNDGAAFYVETGLQAGSTVNITGMHNANIQPNSFDQAGSTKLFINNQWATTLPAEYNWWSIPPSA